MMRLVSLPLSLGKVAALPMMVMGRSMMYSSVGAYSVPVSVITGQSGFCTFGHASFVLVRVGYTYQTRPCLWEV